MESERRRIPGGYLTAQENYFGTVRGRLGFAFDRFLVYGTGGFAYAEREVKTSGGGRTDASVHTGWTAGGGVEWAFDDHWSAKIEYLYADLSKESFQVGFVPQAILADYDQNLVRVGVNYKF